MAALTPQQLIEKYNSMKEQNATLTTSKNDFSAVLADVGAKLKKVEEINKARTAELGEIYKVRVDYESILAARITTLTTENGKLIDEVDKLTKCCAALAVNVSTVEAQNTQLLANIEVETQVVELLKPAVNQ